MSSTRPHTQTLTACVLTLATAVSLGCVTEVQMPPRRPEFLEARRIAVMPFYGDESDGFSAELTAALSTARSSSGGGYSIVARGELGALLDEARQSSETIFDQRTRQRLRLIGADAILTGDVLEDSMTRSDFTKTVSECLESDGLLKCKKSVDRRVGCTRLTASFRVAPRLIQVESGVVLYSSLAIGKETGDICPGARITPAEVTAGARDRALREIIKDAAPYTEVRLPWDVPQAGPSAQTVRGE